MAKGLSDDEHAFLEFTVEDLEEQSQDWAFDINVFVSRISSGELWQQIIQTQLYLDHVLTHMLSDALADPRAIDLSRMSFSQKLALLKAMGLIPLDLVPIVASMNRLRNSIAHKLDFKPSDNFVAELMSQIPASLNEIIKDTPGVVIVSFMHLARVIVLQLEVFRQANQLERLRSRHATLRLRKALNLVSSET